MPGSPTGLRLVAEGVAGEGVLELGHHPDLAGPERVDRLLGLAGEPAQVPHPLAAVAARVVDLAVGPQRARVDPEDGELAHVRVGDGLEYDRAEGRLRVGGALDEGLGPRVRALHLTLVRGRRELLHDEVEQRPYADAARGGGAEHRHHPARHDGAAQGAEHLLLADGAFFQILGEQVVVGLRRGLAELLPVGSGALLQVGRDLGVFRPAVRVGEGAHGNEVHHPAEAGLAADRQLERDEPALQALLQRLERAVEVGPLAVEPVDHDRARAGCTRWRTSRPSRSAPARPPPRPPPRSPRRPPAAPPGRRPRSRRTRGCRSG